MCVCVTRAQGIELTLSPYKQEIIEAIRSLLKGKAVEIDGISTEFFQVFLNEFIDDFFEFVKEVFATKLLGQSFNTHKISLLPKGG